MNYIQIHALPVESTSTRHYDGLHNAIMHHDWILKILKNFDLYNSYDC